MLMVGDRLQLPVLDGDRLLLVMFVGMGCWWWGYCWWYF
jgi:hypothetical protein